MDAGRGAERLATARLEVHRACELLIASTPEALNNCQAALERAVSILREFRADIREYPPRDRCQTLRPQAKVRCLTRRPPDGEPRQLL